MTSFSSQSPKQLQEFPLQSKLDKKLYGDQSSKIVKEHIEINLDGLTMEDVILRSFIVSVFFSSTQS
jgi:hypothetical protein